MHFADNLREVYDLCQKMLYGDGDNDYATDFGLSGEGPSIKDVGIFLAIFDKVEIILEQCCVLITKQNLRKFEFLKVHRKKI